MVWAVAVQGLVVVASLEDNKQQNQSLENHRVTTTYCMVHVYVAKVLLLMSNLV